MYTLKRDFMVGYFFHIAIANRGCTFGIATKAFNLKANSRVKNHSNCHREMEENVKGKAA